MEKVMAEEIFLHFIMLDGLEHVKSQTNLKDARRISYIERIMVT